MTASNSLPTRVLFICLGNICRSVAAEAVFRAMAEAAGCGEAVTADSAGLIDCHEDELADPRMRRHAAARGYRLTHRSRPVCRKDFDRFDLIVVMDASNERGLRATAPSPEAMKKVVHLTDYLTAHKADSVPDPYYGDDSAFEHVLDLIEDACAGLLDALCRQAEAGGRTGV